MDAQSLLIVKLLALALILLSSIAGLALPKVMQSRAPETWSKALNAVAAGVLLSAGLVCMLPDAAALLPKAVAETVAGAAALSMVVVEEVAKVLIKRAEARAAADLESQTAAAVPLLAEEPDDGHGDCLCSSASTVLAGEAAPASSDAWRPSWSGVPNGPAFSTGFAKQVSTGSKRSSATVKVKNVLNNSWDIGSSWALGKPRRSRTSSQSSLAMDKGNPNTLLQSAMAAACGHDADFCYPFVSTTENNPDGQRSGRGLSYEKALCLFVALSFHSVMEGLGVGSQNDPTALYSIIFVILAHKGLASFGLGSALASSKLSTRALMLMSAVFAASTPLGIVLGMWADTELARPQLAIFNAIAGGTFLKVALTELLPASLQGTDGTSIMRCGMVVAGFALMTATILSRG